MTNLPSQFDQLAPDEAREVQRHLQTTDAFEALFDAGIAQKGFSREVMGARMQLMDLGRGWARFRDRSERAYLLVDTASGKLVMSDERWTEELLAVYRGERPLAMEPDPAEVARRERVRACAWYRRKQAALAGAYKAHRRRTPGGGRLYASMVQTLTQLLDEDCTDAESAELAAAAGADLVAAIEDCVIEDMSQRQLAEFRADPTFDCAVAMARCYLAADDRVEKAIAAVRLGRWAREIEERGFSPDANAFALARDEAAKPAQFA